MSDPKTAFAALYGRWKEAPDDPALAAELVDLARAGHAASAHALAHLAFEGIGRPRDTGLAFAWGLRAAHGGFAAAQALVGDFYLHAEPEHGAGVRVAEKALAWHERAAAAGHAAAALTASDSRRMGRGCERDFAAAYRHLRVYIALSNTQRDLVRLLGPSLRADLDDETIARIEEDAERSVEGLPRPDVDLDEYWRIAAVGRMNTL